MYEINVCFDVSSILINRVFLLFWKENPDECHTFQTPLSLSRIQFKTQLIRFSFHLYFSSDYILNFNNKNK